MVCIYCGKAFATNGDNHCAECATSMFIRCTGCNEYIHCDEAYHTRDKWYCQACYDRIFCHCDHCGSEISLENGIRVDNRVYCACCYARIFIKCHACRKVIERADTYTDPEGNHCCQECFHSRCAACEGCGEVFWRFALHSTSHGMYCDDCHRNDEWDEDTFYCHSPTYDKIGSTRRFGIELETSECPNYQSLSGETIFGCKSDPSIEGKEFVSPILYADQGLEAIDRFCTNARKWHWRINRYCGYHVHLDISHESWESLRSIAYAYGCTQELWTQFVSDSRIRNSFCGSLNYESSRIVEIHNATDWDYFVGQRDRFDFINWRAYFAHSSVEIRLHDATLDVNKICNWIKIHARFIDAVSKMSLDELTNKFNCAINHQFANLADIIGPELTDYYADRAESFGKEVRSRAVFAGIPSF